MNKFNSKQTKTIFWKKKKKKQTTHDHDGDYLAYSLRVRARACVFEIQQSQKYHLFPPLFFFVTALQVLVPDCNFKTVPSPEEP